MDKLAKRLHDDAARIDVTITQELDNRIEASLRAVTPEAGEPRPEPAGSDPPPGLGPEGGQPIRFCRCVVLPAAGHR